VNLVVRQDIELIHAVHREIGLRRNRRKSLFGEQLLSHFQKVVVLQRGIRWNSFRIPRDNLIMLVMLTVKMSITVVHVLYCPCEAMIVATIASCYKIVKLILISVGGT